MRRTQQRPGFDQGSRRADGRHEQTQPRPTEGGPVPGLTVAHDYFTQRGGAERVAASLIARLQPESVVTALYERERTFPLSGAIRTTFLQRFGVFRDDPRRALPLLALAWSLLSPVETETVLCSSSGWSHGIPTRRGVRKVVYCHNPPRWLHQPADFLIGQGRAARTALKLLGPALRAWDRRAARSADLYIANSAAVAGRIKTAYGIDAAVVHPPVVIDAAAAQRRPDVEDVPYFLCISRRRGYKNVSTVVDAAVASPDVHLVVVGDYRWDGERPQPANVTFLGPVDDDELRWLYANARALVSMSYEDFGLTPLEANAFGTPVLVLRAGGFLDSTEEGVSGLFVDEPDPDVLALALQAFPTDWDGDAIVRHSQKFSEDAFFARIGECIRALSPAR